MSLNYDLTGIKKFHNLYSRKGNQPLQPKYELVIFLTMTLGLPEITNSNLPEFYKRLWMWETAFGGFKKKGKRLDFKIVRRMVGLITNSCPLTRPKFEKKLVNKLKLDANNAWLDETFPEKVC